MANTTIANLQAALGHGAHENKFSVNISAPAGDTTLGLSESDTWLAKSASYPGKTIGVIKVSKQG